MGEDTLQGEGEALIPVFENGAITGSKLLSRSLATVSHPPYQGCWLLLKAAQGMGSGARLLRY